MKKLMSLLLVSLVIALSVGIAYAASSQNLSVSAVVPNSSPELTLILKELTQEGQNPWSGTTVTTMNFGPLTHMLTDGSDAGVWYSQKYFCVFIFTTSYGHRYEVRSTCNGLTNAGTAAPAGAFGLVPAYAAQDEWSAGNPQGTRPTGSELGAEGSAVGTNKVIYRSETAASNRIIRAFYSLPCYKAGGALPFAGYTPMTLDQKTGTYSATVTISIVAI